MSRHNSKFYLLVLLVRGFSVNDLGMDKNNRFYLARIKKGLSQTEVADILGLNKTAVSKWEGNKTFPDPEVLIKVVDLYQVTADYLLGITNDSQLFDDARVERPEVLELFDQLNVGEQERAIGYMESMLERRGIIVKRHRA